MLIGFPELCSSQSVLQRPRQVLYLTHLLTLLTHTICLVQTPKPKPNPKKSSLSRAKSLLITSKPIYQLLRPVDLSSTGLITLEQLGLSSSGPQSGRFSFHNTDTHSTVNSVLETAFPWLFQHLFDMDMENSLLLSLWLICARKRYRDSDFDVLSTDASSPAGANIISTMKVSKQKVPIDECILYLGM